MRHMPLARWAALLTIALCMALGMATARGQSSQVRGNIDSVSYDSTRLSLHIHGWAWDSVTAQPLTELRISIRNLNFNIAPPAYVNRVDVQKALELATANVGFTTAITLPEALRGGSYPVEITAVFADGRSHLLQSGQGMVPLVSVNRPRDRHWILLALVSGCVGLAYVPWLRRWSDRAGSWIQTHPRRVAAAIGATFALLIALGITGSSWQLLAQEPISGAVEFKSSHKHVFKPKPIRSDEWSILTANALAQWNHRPRFPVVNTHLGPEGQNMGVIGMTGVPIAQPAALARPATWGYFFLPLRQAMAWHWQFPFFACLFLLWKALNLLRPRSSGFNLLLSLTFCVAPYAAGWSLWPLYAALFPLGLFVLAGTLLRSDRFAQTLPLGFAMGLLLAGWVLVLYPPWQITIGTFMAVLAAGWIADHRHELRLGKEQCLALALGISVAAMLVGSWWLDTADAIARIQATAYPGARSLQQGGDLDLFWALRGYTNLETLPFGTGSILNSSEVSGYVLFPLPMLLLGLWLGVLPSGNRWMLRACLAFLTFWLVFRFAGIPIWLSKVTLWSYVTSTRLDLVLGLTCTVLMVLIHDQWRAAWEGRQPPLASIFSASTVALASAGLAALEFHLVPNGLIRANSLIHETAVALAVGIGAWWMMRGRIRAATCMMLLLCLVATLGFNPLSLAPRSVKPSAATAALAADSEQPGRPLRTLVFSEDDKIPMALAAAGVPVVNPTLYYPHRSFWEGIGLPEQDWFEVNRYQHLRFRPAHWPDSPSFQARHLSLDTVEVTVDPQHFDFASTGAMRVVAQEKDATLLRNNPSLAELGHHAGLFWFAVHAYGVNRVTPNP